MARDLSGFDSPDDEQPALRAGDSDGEGLVCPEEEADPRPPTNDDFRAALEVDGPEFDSVEDDGAAEKAGTFLRPAGG